MINSAKLIDLLEIEENYQYPDTATALEHDTPADSVGCDFSCWVETHKMPRAEECDYFPGPLSNIT